MLLFLLQKEMFPHSQKQESLLQNPFFDALNCNEERFDEDLGGGFGLTEPAIDDFNEIHEKPVPFLFEHDLFWEDEEIVTLFSEEKKQAPSSYEMDSDGSLKMVRNEGIKWMLKVTAHYGFTAVTAVLAVNYYDRFISSVCFQKDKPWASQLAAVACLSIAAKVEETQVPLLFDLQVEESKYVFEAKTIMRMEIMVLTTLKWKMNPVTPISFFDHFVRRFALITDLHSEFLRKCESIILSIITDCKLVSYLPSVVAASTMVYVIREIEQCDALDIQNQVLSTLGTSKEKVDDCLKLIMEIMVNQSLKYDHKRKHELIPSSPNGVIEAYFRSESSNDSWSVASSPELLFKKRSLAPLSNSIHWCG